MSAQRDLRVTAASGSQAVPSPCVNICRMQADSGYCEGCLRTLDEIACWSEYSDGEKLGVLSALPARRAIVGR